MSLTFAADKLSDFKEADRYDEGCVTIPTTYTSERSACDREGPNVHPWCDGEKGPVTCGSEEETRKPKRDIENAKKTISDLKNERSTAASNLSNAKPEERRRFEDDIRRIDNNLDVATRALDAAEKSLEARKKLCEDAIDTLDKCLAYRRAVMNSFDFALDKMRNERDTPELKAVADSLVPPAPIICETTFPWKLA
jgi:hypothetical protein